MRKKLPFDWVRTIKKRIEHLTAAENFGDFLRLGLGSPERLVGDKRDLYSLRVTANVRLIIEPKYTLNTIESCDEIEVKGVCDYHGDKINWYIS